MTSTYKLARGWAMFIYIIAPFWIGAFGYLLIAPLLPGGSEDAGMKRVYPIMAPISIVMIALMILGVIDVVKGKFIIAKDYVQSISAIGTRTLLLRDIRGFRVTDKYTFIEPFERHQKRIRISQYYAGMPAILAWLHEHYPDLDILESEQDKAAILDNEQFGSTPEVREQNLHRARTVARFLNWLGGGIGVWVLLFPVPYLPALFAASIYPIICLVILRYFKGLILLEEKKDKAYPSILFSLWLCLLALPIRAFWDFKILDYQHAWAPSLIIAAGLVFLFFAITKAIRLTDAAKYFSATFLIILFFGYAFGLVLLGNCIFDETAPQRFQPTITDKRIVSGKSTTRYFTVTPFGPQHDTLEISVNKTFYERADINDRININLKQGLFNIPWYSVHPIQ